MARFKPEEDTKRRLDAIAISTRNTGAFLLEETAQHMDVNEWQLKCIEEGLEDAEAGRYIDSDTLINELERRIDEGKG